MESPEGNVENLIDAQIRRLKRAVGEKFSEPASARVDTIKSVLVGVPPSTFVRAIMRLKPGTADADEIRAYVEMYEHNKRLQGGA